MTGVDPDFQVARTWQNNVQYELAIGQNYYTTWVTRTCRATCCR